MEQQVDARRRLVEALWCLSGVGPRSIAALLRNFSAEHLLKTPTGEWAPTAPLHASARAALQSIPSLESLSNMVRQKAERSAQRILHPGDAGWPRNLTPAVPDAPPVLFVRGEGDVGASRPMVGIVGTRHPETGALEEIGRLGRELALAGVGVVSGAAEGVDLAAQQGALDGNGVVWAILGMAIDKLPRRLFGFADRVLAQGGNLFSQFPPGTRATRSTFVLRNPVISAVASLVLVARAPERSGALYTARAAIQQRRPLYAVPGDPWNPAAAGSNELLATGAKVCRGADDLLKALGIVRKAPAAQQFSMQFSGLAARIVEALRQRSYEFDELCAFLRADAVGVRSTLIDLELRGVVRQRGGGTYAIASESCCA